MFESLFNLVKQKNLLAQANEQIIEMLKEDLSLFRASVELLWTESGVSFEEIKQRDRQINRFVREVRKKVLTYLAFSGLREMDSAIIILYLVVYIERIGDHTKDISRLATDYPNRFKCGKLEKDVKDFERQLFDRLERLIDIFETGDNIREKASGLTRTHPDVDKVYLKMINRLLTPDNTEGLACAEGVKLALYLRYLRRIEGHIFNIASSEVNPFHRIGFSKKKKSAIPAPLWW